MTNVQNSVEIINFWALDRLGRHIIVGSDLTAPFTVLLDRFEDYLLKIGKIGEWYCDQIEETIMVTEKDFWKSCPHEINELLDDFIKGEWCPASPVEYDLIHQLGPDCWDYANLPQFDPYERTEGHQRPYFEEMI